MSEPKPIIPDRLKGPAAQHRYDLKRQIMIVVLVLLGAFAIQMTVESIIMISGMFSSGFFEKLMGDAVASGGMVDPNKVMDSLLDTSSPTADILGIISISAAICSLPVFLILRGKRLFANDITERRKPMSISLLLQLFIIAMSAQLIFSLLSAGLNSLIAPLGFDTTALYESSIKALSTPTGMVYIMLIGPICEEIMFRGAILKSLERFGGNFAIVMSSLFFGLFHIFTIQAIFAFLVGLILGCIAHRYSVLWSIVVHILINSVSTALEDLLPPTATGIVFVAFFAGGVVLFILMRGQLKEQRTAGRPFVIVPNREIYPSYVIGDAGTGDPELTPPGFEQKNSVPVWGEDAADTIEPKLFRIAFSTVSLDIYIVGVLIAGIALMSGAIAF